MGNVVSLRSATAQKQAALAARHQVSPHGLPLVYIVVLNYKRADLTEACIESLQELQYPNTRLVVVDNHSQDGCEKRFLQHPAVYRFIQSPFNSGYSAGNNLGIRLALAEGAEYVWVLNNDTRVSPEALDHLVQAAEEQGHGVYGSVLKETTHGGFLYAGGVFYPWKGRTRGLTEADYQNGQRPQYLSGASLLLSRRVLQEVGLLEESYFLYAEDIEYCLRASRAGFPITSVSSSVVYHHQGASSGGSERPINQYYGQRNRMKLFWRHGSTLQRGVLALLRTVEVFVTGLKALVHPSAERKKRYQKRWKIIRAAYVDFFSGVVGASPHAF